MKRMALLIAALFITASSLSYLVGLRAVFILGSLLCFAAGVCAVLGRRNGFGLKPAAVLLVGAAFCLFLNVYTNLKVGRAKSLIGDTRTVTCRVVEEPEEKPLYVVLYAETDGSNGFDSGPSGSVRLVIYVHSSLGVPEIYEGDILSVELTFNEVDESLRKFYYGERVFVSTRCSSVEVIGHKESLYTYCIDLRRAVRRCLNSYADGDTVAVLQGLLLGGTDAMSDELYVQFKICGVSHITAVSGMHIGAFCTMMLTLLGLVMKRRKAALITIMPLMLAIMLAGLTPSAIRAGIMCGIMLLSECLLKKTDSLNSLGVSIAVMLAINPYYVCSLSFQLSCSATAGVIVISPYANTAADKLVKFNIRFLTKIFKAAVFTFVQSIGAVVCTLPFQMIEMGSVSVIAPLASMLICSAAVYAMAVSIVGVVLNFIPIMHCLAVIPFYIAELLGEYICVCVQTLSQIPFSYIPFGRDSAVLWMGLSLAVLALWKFLNRPGGKRVAMLTVFALLLVTLWSDYAYTRNMCVVAVPNTGNGLCAVVTYGDSCVIIGCGDGSSDRYAVREYIKRRGVSQVDILLIPSDSDTCFGGFDAFLTEIKPITTVVPENFGSFTKLTRDVEVAADGEEFSVADGDIKITAVLHGNGCVYELTSCGKRMLIGCGYYDAEALGISDADLVVTGRVVPRNTNAEITIISLESERYENPVGQGRIITTAGNTVSVKFKSNKGMSVYAG